MKASHALVIASLLLAPLAHADTKPMPAGGMGAGMGPDMMQGGMGPGMDDLKLSADQKQKIDAIREDTRKKVDALHEENHQKILQVLTPEQAKKWEEHRKDMMERHDDRMKKHMDRMEKHGDDMKGMKDKAKPM